MSLISVASDPLDVAIANPVAWALLTASIYYEVSVWDIIVVFAALTKGNNANIGAMMVNPVDVATIVSDVSAVSAVVASVGTFDYAMADNIASGLFADSTIAMNAIVAAKAGIQTSVAASVEMMPAIAARPVAFGIVSNSIASVQAIADNATAWNTFRGSATFLTYLKEIITATAGLDGTHASVDAIIADATALALVAADSEASQAMASSSAAVATLASSANLGIILDSATAMTHFATEANIQAFLDVPAAVAPVFGSSAAKGVIMNFTSLVDSIAGNGTTLTYLAGLTATAIPASNRSGTTAADDPFDGIPSKVLVLGMRANNIGAIAVAYDFDGSVVAGTTPGTGSISLKGTVTEVTCTAYTDPTWTVAGIAITSASSPQWVYVDMT
jgi:hypothetical protein